MTQDEIRMELAMRLRRENYFHGGMMPRETAIAWKGYLFGCLEWGKILGADYHYLLSFLPPLEEGAVEDIAGGRDLLPDEAEISQLEPREIKQDTNVVCPTTIPRFISGRVD